MGNVVAQLSLLEKLEGTDQNDSMVKENKDHEDTDKQMDSKIVAKEMKRQRLTNSGAHLQAESVDSVAWCVPHKKRGHQQQPGFNLDYAPPKTHPPVHN